jgi:hypothetical protein
MALVSFTSAIDPQLRVGCQKLGIVGDVKINTTRFLIFRKLETGRSNFLNL